MIRLLRSIIGLVLALPEGKGSGAWGLPPSTAFHAETFHRAHFEAGGQFCYCS